MESHPCLFMANKVLTFILSILIDKCGPFILSKGHVNGKPTVTN